MPGRPRLGASTPQRGLDHHLHAQEETMPTNPRQTPRLRLAPPAAELPDTRAAVARALLGPVHPVLSNQAPCDLRRRRRGGARARGRSVVRHRSAVPGFDRVARARRAADGRHGAAARRRDPRRGRLPAHHLPEVPARERWRRVPGHRHYQVSDLGRARSLDHTLPSGRMVGGVMLTQRHDRDGYRRVARWAAVS